MAQGQVSLQVGGYWNHCPLLGLAKNILTRKKVEGATLKRYVEVSRSILDRQIFRIEKCDTTITNIGNKKKN